MSFDPMQPCKMAPETKTPLSLHPTVKKDHPEMCQPTQLLLPQLLTYQIKFPCRLPNVR